jgi:glycosyltransferase involved in cell wall biosynthesis
MRTPGLDVIVPCYNYGRYLRQCTMSVLQEARLSLRILIIDDASTDGGADEARQLAAEDDRIEVKVHATNKGHIATYNEGIDWVRQDYMLLLSADDMVAPGALMRAVQLMEAQPDIAFIFGHAVRFQAEDELPDGWREGREDAGPHLGAHIAQGWDFISRLCHSSMNPVETATAVVRSAVQKRVGGYAAELPHSADLEMWLRCARHGHVAEIGAVQAFVRLHGANMRNGYCGDYDLGDYLQRRDAFLSFFDQGSDGPARSVLRSTALETLARNLLWSASRAIEEGRDCSESLTLALDIHPEVRRTPQYRRLMIKRGLNHVLSVGRPAQRRNALI